MKSFIRYNLIFFFIIMACITQGCAKKIIVDSPNKETKEEIEETYVGGKKFEISNVGGFDNEEIYILKNQALGQNLSILIKTKSGKIIVIDGGRPGDAEFLLNVIEELGSKVDAWFITHCHDDHVGALYELLENRRDEIFIENIYYDFPDFMWAYNLVGPDIGFMNMVEASILDYKEYMDQKDIEFTVKIHNVLEAGEVYDIDGVKVNVLNSVYQIDDDPINNSSIAYKVEIGKKSMTVLGDLSYEGGCRLLEDAKIPLKSDFVVMAHHGQAGVGEEVYKAIDPSYCIWCTTEDIYNNEKGHYETDNTKDWMLKLKIKKHFITLKTSFLIR